MNKKQNNHLAEGEVTGHYHEVIGKEVEVFEGVFNDESLELCVPQGGRVVHQEHKSIEIPAGKYRTGQVLEYDPALEETRQIKD